MRHSEELVVAIGQLIDKNCDLQYILEITRDIAVTYAIRRCNNNHTEAAQSLRVHRNTVQRILRRMNVHNK